MAAPAGYDPGQSLLAGGSGHLEAMRGGGMVGGDGDFKLTDEIIQLINKQILEIFKTSQFNPDKLVRDVESDMSGGGDFTSFPIIRDEWPVRKQHILAALNAMNDAKSGSSINNLVGAINQVIRDGYFVKSGGVYVIEGKYLDGRISYRFADILRLIRTIANYLEGLTYNIKFSDTTNATIKNVPVTYMPAEAETGGAGAGATAPVPAPASAASDATTTASGSAAAAPAPADVTGLPKGPAGPATESKEGDEEGRPRGNTAISNVTIFDENTPNSIEEAHPVQSFTPAQFTAAITDVATRDAVSSFLTTQPGDTADKKVFSFLASLLSAAPKEMGDGGKIDIHIPIPKRTAGAGAGAGSSNPSTATDAAGGASAGATPPTATSKKGGTRSPRKTRRRHKTLRKAKGPVTRRSKA